MALRKRSRSRHCSSLSVSAGLGSINAKKKQAWLLRPHRAPLHQRHRLPAALTFSLLPPRSMHQHESCFARIRRGKRVRGDAHCRSHHKLYESGCRRYWIPYSGYVVLTDARLYRSAVGESHMILISYGMWLIGVIFLLYGEVQADAYSDIASVSDQLSTPIQIIAVKS
jgi:hypothetical protein